MKRKHVLLAGCAAVVGIALFPPYQFQALSGKQGMGFALIGDPPVFTASDASQYFGTVNTPLLAMELLVAILVIGTLAYIAKNDQ